MDLCDGCCGYRGLAEFGINIFQFVVELVLNNRLYFQKRKWLHRILQFPELFNNIRRENIPPYAQKLAQLDKGGAQLFQSMPKSPPSGGSATS